jgi:glutamate decarboxylase
MLASLYHSPAVDENGVGDAVGTASVGSSEAIMLGALALKKIWAERRVAEGKDASKPNLVMVSSFSQFIFSMFQLKTFNLHAALYMQF